MVVAVGARGGDNVGGGVIGAVGTAKGVHTCILRKIQYRLALGCSELYRIKVDHTLSYIHLFTQIMWHTLHTNYMKKITNTEKNY